MFFIRLLLLSGIFLGVAVNASKHRKPAARFFKDLSPQSALVSRYACTEFIAIYYPLPLRLKAMWLKDNPFFDPTWTKKEQLTKLNKWATTLIAGETRTNIQRAIRSALEKIDNKKSPQKAPEIALVDSGVDDKTTESTLNRSFDAWGDDECAETASGFSADGNATPRRDDVPECWESGD